MSLKNLFERHGLSFGGVRFVYRWLPPPPPQLAIQTPSYPFEIRYMYNIIFVIAAQ